ncbi:hypothetical protein ACIPW9_10975 [Streptomyces sp. NPDC090052]|uniref:hypothetical protein n=2 Tax=unclassified Streptomyces TaxID=2593676 RepID=UPI0032470378|nr:hypothetical protein OG221_21430 [Streptomyces sp. NBC_00932]
MGSPSSPGGPPSPPSPPRAFRTGTLADALNDLPAYAGMASEALIREHCFVPAVSAVDIKGVATHDELYTPVDGLAPEETGWTSSSWRPRTRRTPS